MKTRTERGQILEAGLWLAGLTLMAASDPWAPAWLDLCLIDALGFPFCPGEGLGHAIGFLARGEWLLAIASHWASPFVVSGLLVRSGSLIHNVYRTTCPK
ncbi:MAG: DUF2752 domain-containing protein [Rhodothermales bacterium]